MSSHDDDAPGPEDVAQVMTWFAGMTALHSGLDTIVRHSHAGHTMELGRLMNAMMVPEYRAALASIVFASFCDDEAQVTAFLRDTAAEVLGDRWPGASPAGDVE